MEKRKRLILLFISGNSAAGKYQFFDFFLQFIYVKLLKLQENSTN